MFAVRFGSSPPRMGSGGFEFMLVKDFSTGILQLESSNGELPRFLADNRRLWKTGQAEKGRASSQNSGA